MRIGELGRQAGVSAKTIRYYEEIGLLPEPDRTDNGYRDYGKAAAERLTFIRDAQATGLSLTEIASILELRGQGVATCGHVVDLLEHHLEDIDRQIDNLHQTRRKLRKMTERARSMDPANCSDPHRCQTISHGAAESAGPAAARQIHGSPSAHARA